LEPRPWRSRFAADPSKTALGVVAVSTEPLLAIVVGKALDFDCRQDLAHLV
jgi:hypothetical protein